MLVTRRASSRGVSRSSERGFPAAVRGDTLRIDERRTRAPHRCIAPPHVWGRHVERRGSNRLEGHALVLPYENGRVEPLPFVIPQEGCGRVKGVWMMGSLLATPGKQGDPTPPLARYPRPGHPESSLILPSRRAGMVRLWHTTRARLLLAATALLALSCGESSTSGEPTIARIDAAPAQLDLTIGETRAVTARALDAGGAAVSRRLFWSVADPQIATVTQGGIVTSVAPGTTQVAVSAGGESTIVPVTVAGRDPSLVQVSPASATIMVGGTTALTATVLDASGAVVPGSVVTWSSATPATAVVSSAGIVTGVAAGTATISATITIPGGARLSGSAVIQVQPVPVAAVAITPSTASLLAGQSLQLTVAVTGAGGVPLTGRAVTWSTSAPTVANVSSTGMVIAFAPGTATITAASEGRSSTARLTVSAVPVATVTLVPSAATVAVGQTAQLIARVADSTGALLDGRAVTWRSDTPAAVTVDALGVVSAVAAGSARITATAEGRSGSAVVTVTPIPVAALQVTPGASTLVEGDTLQLTARALDGQGNVLAGRVVSWISGAPTIATVDAGGRVTAVGPGAALIIASSEGVRATVQVTVTAATVASVVTTPATATVQEGRTLQLTASALDARGRVMAGQVVTWSSSNVNVATVSSSGLVQSIARGSATITATVNGVAGRTTLSVIPVPVAAVSIAPTSAALSTGRTLQLTATLTDTLGRPLSLAGRTVTWTSSAPSIATVGATGVVTGASPGIVTITATAEGKTGVASIIVSLAPVATVNVSASVGQASVGSSTQFSATALDAGGAVLTGRAVAWSTSDPTVATVSTSGLVSALAPGTVQVTATIGGVAGSAPLTVVPVAVAVAAVVLTPGTGALLPGGTLQLVATPRDSAGLPVTGRTATWSSAAPAVASVDASGLVTALSVGSAAISATVDGVSGSATITVGSVPIASIAISPTTASVTAGATTTLSATPLDAGGNVLPGRTLTWSSDNTAVASVTQGGVVTGVSSGAATITVSGASPGQATPVSSSVTLTVIAATVKGPARVVITRIGGTIHVGSLYARRVSAQVFDAAGALMPGEVITWTTSDAALLSAAPASSTASTTITASGAPTAGLQLIATAAGASSPVADTLVISSDLVRIARVSASPFLVSIPVKSTRTLSVVATDSASNAIGTANGNPLGGRPIVWKALDGRIASVDSLGVATGVQRGLTRIDVTVGGVGPGIVTVLVP
jgi:trimeric autotransporter adhesin